MAWYRRSRLGFNTISNFITSKITTAPKPIIRPLSTLTRPDPSVRIPKFPLFSPVCVKKASNLPSFSTLYARNYYVDSRQVKHFRPRGFKRWFENPRNVFMVVLVGSGIGVTLYYGNIETVPYTKRKHLILMSKNVEKMIGESQFTNMKAGFKGKILPAMHPESIRVRMISKDIIEALQRGLKKEQGWTDLNYASEGGASSEKRGKEAVMAIGQESDAVGDKWMGKEEVMDDMWVDKSRKKGKDKGHKADTAHLEGLKWEVLVVNDHVVNAFCLPGGKIVVFTGLLEHFKTDEEVATIIGHEVAHCVARHAAEQITKNLWFTIGQLILYQFVMPDLVNTMSNLLLKLPFSRRMEIEADYIGVLLMASAGYDPRIAPKVFEKLGQVSGDSALQNYLSTHPSGKKRSKLLSEANVMHEALSIYRESMSGREVDGFFL
uniref:uncharacterized protein LOC122580514 n=1 Tax=Erigeron canadensis TaxID=72917 RepID=UPI001CB96548|nr:uncharacterized protein LOC122580514 [Erigeron canadensis]